MQLNINIEKVVGFLGCMFSLLGCIYFICLGIEFLPYALGHKSFFGGTQSFSLSAVLACFSLMLLGISNLAGFIDFTFGRDRGFLGRKKLVIALLSLSAVGYGVLSYFSGLNWVGITTLIITALSITAIVLTLRSKSEAE